MWQPILKEASSVMNMTSLSDLLNPSKQDTSQAGHMLDNLCGNNFVEKEVAIWLDWFYFHLHNNRVISLDYVIIILI